MPIQLVIQEDPKGCGIATLAMICGESYAQVKAKVGRMMWNGHCTHYEMFGYLSQAGFSYQQWTGWNPNKEEASDGGAGCTYAKRHPWPIPTPFAPAHILLTRGPEMGHWVAMDSEGEIFDPIRGRGKAIAEYDVQQIIGTWIVK